ncbi:Chromosomal replication initiator protein DnaA [Dissostichus eleginoides]|uniref:Chromosomal replication initiator protein DnaA n=1 Tax=Dissostichus eleginoides TaxID=100907 RepID=A0AAD9CL35_DISEL|nr:Chromosomal replication initiator protein DnaA [Dissostichus eleginoides]
MLLRVIISQNDIRRLRIENIPTSIEGLNLELRTNLGLTGGFILQFEDPDFDNQLCNLTDIKDLPVERATLKVLFTTDVDVSDSTLDTCSLPLVSSGDSVEWPNPFPSTVRT